MTAVSLNVGGGVRLIKPAKLYMCMQTYYKHDEDGRMAPGVRHHGSVLLSLSENVVTRIGLYTAGPFRAVTFENFGSVTLTARFPPNFAHHMQNEYHKIHK